MIKEIKTKKQLLDLKKKLGVRDDWKGADDQGIDVTVIGHRFDNAGSQYEQYAKIRLKGKTVATINLATLFAYATGYTEGE